MIQINVRWNELQANRFLLIKLNKFKGEACLLCFIGLSKERPVVIYSLNLNLSQISSFMHIYGFADFKRFVDLQILADFRI